MRTLFLCLFLGLFFFTSCEDKDNDDRIIEPARIVGIKINDVLYTVDNSGTSEALIVVPSGTDLSAIKTEILVSNGTLEEFTNNTANDMRKPIAVTLKGENGETIQWTVKVQSPPKLISLYAQGLDIPKENVHFGATSIIVEIAKESDVSNLAVDYEFLNGTLKNYTNGTEMDYSDPTKPFKLQVLGVDETTIYKYDVIFTTDQVGPASIKSITANGIVSDSVVVLANNVLQPYFPYLTNFRSSNIEFETGFGNILDPSFATTNVNLYNNPKVKVTGSNGVETEFTIKKPLIASIPVVDKSHEDLQFAANSGSSAAFSNGKILIASHQMATGATASLGINVYDLTGNYIKGLSKTGTNFDGGAVTGVRKFATDADGKILGVQLGAGAGATTELKIFKWDSVDDNAPTAYITYTQTSLGLGYAPRAAGINITGSLSGNATIVVPIAQKTDVLVWTVTNGVLNTTPQKYAFPYTGTGYYFSVEAFDSGFIGAATGSNFNGINLLNSTMTETVKITGVTTTDIKTFTYNGQKLAAYTVFANGKHIFRIVDLTTADQAALENPIMNISSRAVSNANNTVDSDFAIINNKLYVLFYGTNDGIKVYKLEQ